MFSPILKRRISFHEGVAFTGICFSTSILFGQKTDQSVKTAEISHHVNLSL